MRATTSCNVEITSSAHWMNAQCGEKVVKSTFSAVFVALGHEKMGTEVTPPIALYSEHQLPKVTDKSNVCVSGY